MMCNKTYSGTFLETRNLAHEGIKNNLKTDSVQISTDYITGFQTLSVEKKTRDKP